MVKLDVEYVIEKYGDMVYRIALNQLGSVENAEDAFQDVFIKYSDKLLGFKDEEHIKAWLIRVTINISKNMKASSWNRKRTDLTEDIPFEEKEISEVYNAVQALPENYKQVIYLNYYEGYKISEIAQILKINENTIKTWNFRARKLLKESLEGGFENE